MNSHALADTVKNRLAILIDVPAASIPDDVPFSELNVDSLMLLELVALIEQHVGFELPEQDLRSLRTMADVERYVVKAEAQAGGNGGPDVAGR